MTYEDWWNLFQVLSVALVAITFSVGALAFFTGYKTRQEKDVKAAEQRERIAGLLKETEQLKLKVEEEAVKRLEAEKQLEQLKKGQSPRVLRTAELIEALKDKPAGKAEILYQEGDGEAHNFAGWLKSTLVFSKWEVGSEPQPIGDRISGSYSGIPIEALREMPSPRRLGAAPTGVSIIANRKTMDGAMGKGQMNPISGLLQALSASSINVSLGQDDSALPDDFIRIVVAQK